MAGVVLIGAAGFHRLCVDRFFSFRTICQHNLYTSLEHSLNKLNLLTRILVFRTICQKIFVFSDEYLLNSLYITSYLLPIALRSLSFLTDSIGFDISVKKYDAVIRNFASPLDIC